MLKDKKCFLADLEGHNMKNWNPKMFIDGINYLTKIMSCYLADLEGHKMKN